MATILELRQNLRWPRNIFQIVWSKVHESTEKTLTGKKGSFYLARSLLYGARAEKPLQNADFAMKQTNICRLSGDIINIIPPGYALSAPL